MRWRSQVDHAGGAAQRHDEAPVQLAQGGTAVGTGINAHPRFGAKVAVLLSEQTGVPFASADNHVRVP